MNNKEELKLQANDRVAVIGAGPSGSLFAYCLLRLAHQQKLPLRVTIYDPHDFFQSGPFHCNKCAGVLNNSFCEHLERIGIDVDQAGHLIQSRLKGYLWSTENSCQRIDMPAGWQPCRTVFRANGPAFSDFEQHISFDRYLLQQAIKLEAKYVKGRVVNVRPSEKGGGPVRFDLQRTESAGSDLEVDGPGAEKRVGTRQEEAQLVVGAFGLNPHMMQQFEQLGIGYKSPRTVRAAQITLLRRPELPPKELDYYIRVYNITGRRVRQLVLTPKGRYATLTLLAPHDLSTNDLHDIRDSKEVREIYRDGWEWPEKFCFCLPLIFKRCARNFFGDRIVVIGDAACSRYYKNGMESAMRSAEIAADTVLFHGISRRAFRWWYFPRVWREIIHDNFYGRFLLQFYNFMSTHPRMMQLSLQTRAGLTRTGMIQRFQDILWDMFTGNRPYRHIFYRILYLPFQLDLWLHLFHLLTKRFKETVVSVTHRQRPAPARAQSPGVQSNRFPGTNSRLLHSGYRISIIGGGPAGSSCAIALGQLARRKNMELEVTIHEPKDFAAAAAIYHPAHVPFDDKRINQCIGVLSPPIYEIMTQKLGIGFPDHLVQKYIIGYVLHHRHQSITLDELYGASYAMRRITFDAYMMQQAVRHGAILNLSPVEWMERKGDTFKIISSSATTPADVVVGAFGVDQDMANIFTSCFGYRRPEYMQTIITKQHPVPEFLREFGLRIHAFLPPLRAVEFGAITPKYNHLSINIAGRTVDTDTMIEFLNLPQVARLLPDDYEEKGSQLYYPGCFPTSPANNLCADRMVVVGDASGMLRPFKGKGINSAILSGLVAARVMVHRGVGARDFRQFYLPVFHHITEDIMYARIARLMTNLLADYGGMDQVLKLAQDSPPLQRALTEAVSGACNYKTILKRLTRDRILWRGSAMLMRKILS
ncbi:MAG: FAD/NAD(P)-binding protein [Sedimentisphaerales bacterium]|nr:FAD/NAD(P)-binding protein [Sedimentisphaerales bacterium]